MDDVILETLEVLVVHPNPCHGSVHIRMNGSSRAGEDNSILIYNAAGLLVREYTITGNNDQITWTGDDRNGQQLPGGVYFLRSDAADPEKTYKVIFLR